jgi:predicted TIM-barrel fold metal-dependent hydrolase
MTEEILDPQLPIIDPHHHLWDWSGRVPHLPAEMSHPFEAILRQSPRYLLDELLADAMGGHNVIGTVYVQCGAFYRADGPEAMQPVGETEFVNGVAAMAASGTYGPVKACAGIVGHVDLGLGDGVAEVLDAHIAVGGGRFRGIRHMMAQDDDAAVLGPLAHAAPHLCADPQVRRALAHFGPRNLSLDVWVVEPQLGEVVELARAFPDLPMVIDHVGTPLGLGVYAGKREARFANWAASIKALADCPNVFMKLGGLGMPFPGFEGLGPDVRPSSATLAAAWAPYIHGCIEAFGAARCMFESNFPVDRWGADYATLWNAFKRVAAGASSSEKAALFGGTAAKFYRLEGLA